MTLVNMCCLLIRPKMAEVLDMVNTIITEFYEQQEDTKDVEVASANAEFAGEQIGWGLCVCIDETRR